MAAGRRLGLIKVITVGGCPQKGRRKGRKFTRENKPTGRNDSGGPDPDKHTFEAIVKGGGCKQAVFGEN